ncbi:MAG: isovaleryl-CoA dehydrogenase [Acidimicrobiia bacterium]
MTHVVSNQPPPLEGHNVFTRGEALLEAVTREGAGDAFSSLVELGALAGSPEAIMWGVAANASPPALHTHDRFGNRIDAVEYHPAYHQLMRIATAHGLHAAPWAEPTAGAHVARAAKFIVWSQVDAGHGCPISMTYSVVPALRLDPEAAAQWEPGLTSTSYDASDVAPAEKTGLLAGMGMTEKQGGSDVRTNTTRAEPDADGYRLTGHKWFCSAPMSDVFLMLAQAPGGLSCFVVPRHLPDGTRNAIRIQRLKDKLGNRSNASSEIELEAAWATRLGEEGRGVPTIATMVNHTRLDCVLGATATMRQALAQAIHHTHYREAFGDRLDRKPLMRAVLADLALETEAATATALRLARAYDSDDPREVAFRRFATAVAKYWICKRQPAMVAEALECVGGNGYVEDSGMPRLFRESPLNGIWEGSGNVMCLDVLRAANREPGTLDAFVEEIAPTRGASPILDRFTDQVLGEIREPSDLERLARRTVEGLALALQASLLLRHAPASVGDAFVHARVGPERGLAFGALPAGIDVDTLVSRAR